jgi:hypothetical protein
MPDLAASIAATSVLFMSNMARRARRATSPPAASEKVSK